MTNLGEETHLDAPERRKDAKKDLHPPGPSGENKPSTFRSTSPRRRLGVAVDRVDLPRKLSTLISRSKTNVSTSTGATFHNLVDWVYPSNVPESWPPATRDQFATSTLGEEQSS